MQRADFMPSTAVAGAQPGDDVLDRLPRIAPRTVRSPSDFAAMEQAGAPVLIKNAFDQWPALGAGRGSAAELVAYLKALDNGGTTAVVEAPARTGGRFCYASDIREFTFTKRSAPIPATLDRIVALAVQPEAPFVAIQKLALDTHMPGFARQNPMPLLPPGTEPRLWFGGPIRTQTHHDRDHNLACVIAGTRRFVLFPPDQVANLYVGPMDNPPPLSLVDPQAPDLERFPRFAEALATARVAFLTPGDALFMPRYWWHHVTSLGPINAMVNYWWGDDAKGVENPQDVFLAALLALRDLPAGERSYWQALFEHHVFGEADTAAEHIPVGLRGPLGRMTPSARAALARRLRSAFQSPN